MASLADGMTIGQNEGAIGEAAFVRAASAEYD